MLEVEFWTPTSDLHDHRKAATLIVRDDGTHSLTGDESLTEELLDVPFLYRDDSSNEVYQVRFEDQPMVWARNCAMAFRTPYIVPRIVHDDDADQATDDHGVDHTVAGAEDQAPVLG